MTAQEAIKKVTEAIETLDKIIATYGVLQGLSVSLSNIKDIKERLIGLQWALKVKGYDELEKQLADQAIIDVPIE